MKKNGVVCAIDVNDYDQDVIDLAAEFAKRFGVDLDLIHVTFLSAQGDVTSAAYLNSQTALVGDHRRLLKIKTNVEGVKIHFHHQSGFPSDLITGFVQRNEPRLLVLGTHARRGLSRILGSIAMKIMRNVACPVMVLRQKRNNQSPAGQSESLTV